LTSKSLLIEIVERYTPSQTTGWPERFNLVRIEPQFEGSL
jgi:hypothetical protein